MSKIIIFLITFNHFVSVYSQKNDSNYQLIIAVGSNVVDDTFTANYKPFNMAEQWNIGKFPSYFSLSSELVERKVFEIMISTNVYEKGKLVNGKILENEMDYFALDFFFQYNFIGEDSNFINNKLLDPFIKIGIGETKIESNSFFTINYGLGTYIWIPAFSNCNCALDGISTSDLGIIIGTMGKSSFQQNVNGNQLQHTIGICYRF